MPAYVAYGVRVESEIPLRGLPQARSDGPTTTITVLRDQRSDFDAPMAASDAAATFLIDGRPLWLHVNGDLEICWRDIFRFRLRVGDSRICCSRGAHGSAEQVRDWLLHYALPLLLLSESRLQFLHGSGVEIGQQAVGFLAGSGGGKTTLGEYFVQRGHRFFTDEKLGFAAHRREFIAVPSTPFYRSAETNARWQAVQNFAASPAPLHTLYVLVSAPPGATPAVTAVPAGAAVFELARRCEFQLPGRVRRQLRLPSFQVTCFDSCTALAAAVRVCRLLVPRDRTRLPEVYDAVIADVAGSA